MKKYLLNLFAAFFVSTALFAQTISDRYQDGKIWFKLKNNVSVNRPISGYDPYEVNINDVKIVHNLTSMIEVKKLTQPFHAVKNYAELSGVYMLELSNPSKIDLALEILLSDKSVEYAEKVPLDRPMAPPNDTYYSSQWEHTLINSEAAWVFSAGSSSVKVAIVDDAFQANITAHPDLNFYTNPGEITNGLDDDNNGYKDDVRGFDVTNNSWLTNPPTNQYYHGTRVAGTVGAITNNAIGVASIGNGIKIIPVKASDSPGTISNGYEGVVFAAIAGSNVICMPWGSPVSSITGQNVINFARLQGCVLVAAAGNDNTNSMYYPAAYNHVIAVAATQSNDVKATFSNYGTWIDVSAPGVNIYTTDINSGYVVESGTSISAGIVAGLAGLMLSFNPGLTPEDVEACIKSSAVSIATQNPTFTGMLGTGRINASASMACVTGTTYNTPVANFRANTTTVMKGGKVIFANTSTHSPTSYTWNFQGGIPSSTITSTKNPVEVTYNTTGLKSVTLTANRTAPAGSDVEIKVGYINVINGGTCDTAHWNHTYQAPIWTPTNFIHGGTDTALYGRYIIGVNTTNTKEFAQLFDISGNGQDTLLKVWIYFGDANFKSGGTSAGKYIRIKVYDQNTSTGNPNNLLYTSDQIPFQTIINDVAAGKRTEFKFPSPIPIPQSGPGITTFFISVAMMNDAATGGNLDWAANRDTLSLITNYIGETNGTDIYRLGANGWCRIDANCGPGVPSYTNPDISAFIFPFLTDQVVRAVFTQSDDTICEGTYVIYDATGSTHQDTLSWTFAGGNPSHSNRVRDTVFYVNKTNNAYQQFNTTLIVRGGGCVDADTMIKSIVVHSSPRITVTNSSSYVCLGGAASVTASATSSLASSFTWSPATGLSSSTGSSVVISPSSTQTYDVNAVSAKGCEGNTSFTILVDTVPMPVITAPDTACAGDPVQFNGNLSQGAVSYSWSFSGATPSTSTSINHIATYSVMGTFTYTLQTTNSCGTSSVIDSVMVTCISSVDELFSSNTVKAYFVNEANSVELAVYADNAFNSNTYVKLINQLGQVVDAKAIVFNKGMNFVSFDASRIARGVYTILITDNKSNSYSQKLVVH